MASDDHFWTYGEVVARAARMGREPLRSMDTDVVKMKGKLVHV